MVKLIDLWILIGNLIKRITAIKEFIVIEEEILEVPEEVNQPTPDEQYFSRSLDKWIYVSDMNDMHVGRLSKTS